MSLFHFFKGKNKKGMPSEQEFTERSKSDSQEKTEKAGEKHAGSADHNEEGLPLCPIGYKSGWVIVKDTTPEEVMERLSLENAQRVGWNYGVKMGSGQGKLFLSDPVDGFVVIYDTLDLVDESEEFLERIASQFQEVMSFVTHHVVEVHSWMRYTDGRLVRKYYFIGESGEVDSVGELTAEELELGFDTFPQNSDDVFEDGFGIPDEEDVIRISRQWGFDPTVEAHANEKISGYLVDI